MLKLKNVKQNDGFTLVELMIVLSIIAILAVVLVPKVGSMKDSVRNQGVAANVTSVRAFLELHINDRESNVQDEEDRLIDLFQDEFTEGDAIENPFTGGNSIDDWDSNRGDDDYSVVVDGNTFTFASALTSTHYTATYSDRKGKVIVWVVADGYAIWGHDGDGNSLEFYTVR